MIELRPVTQAIAFDFIRQNHRHHDVPVGALWWHGVHNEEGSLVGVSIVGRPVARNIDDGLSVEVTRLCTDGSLNACSMLYGASRRVAIAKGYRRGITYTLPEEGGASLRAAGWTYLGQTPGRSWSVPSRPREDKHPLGIKDRWGFGLWPEFATQEAGNAQSTPPISPEEAQFNAVRYHERFGPLDEKGNPLDPRRRG